MSFLSLIAALLIEQVWPLNPRCTVYRWFTRYVNLLGSHFNAGEQRQGVIAWCLAVLPWVIVCIAVYHLLREIHVVFGWVWSVAVLYLTMGFRQFSHAFTGIVEALRVGDLDKARQLLAEWRGESAAEYNGTEIAKVAIEEGLIGAHRHVFGVIFWFLILPGPSGAVLYRLAGLLNRNGEADPRRTTASSDSLRAKCSTISTGSRCG
jgi:cobalamin biosynthesis protein CobD/CbiB